ncbi:MAG: epoxyqueuosine reductase QueH [Lachnospiraceae bacterium]|nr:epoxyqueuosine reductase QueH [Lachnospiraceae bacterium]MDD7026477.1 epoxyqueuosine reductase QueH [Lachnospiraceae bacterium]MDY5701571.1 epoxyqueuosine reductase QueH [Lachnospiraceae bacterium]
MTQNKPQYHKEMEKIIGTFKGERKRLLLHSCCAPCSSGVLVPLQEVFDLTVYYYNPNISEQEEYRKRATEQKKLINALNQEKPAFPIGIIEEDYEPESFYAIAKGLEKCPEGGERCFRCYGLRLEKTAQKAKAEGFDYFTTTLTISPLKNAEKINTIGKTLEEKYGVSFLPSDFKKRDGYKNSIALSRKYDLYRQNFCGCIFSKVESLSKEGKI